MPGAGTRTAATASRPAARLLDLTRLISRQGRGPLTGIDRVELAYLRALCAAPEPLFLLVRTSLGYILVGPDQARAVLDRVEGRVPWGRVDLPGRLMRGATPEKRRALADLRRMSFLRVRRGKLRRALAHLPPGSAYLNVGHSNLGAEVFAACTARGLSVAVMIHDTIPLDYPHFQRAGTVEAFRARLARVLHGADLVLCNSAATRADVIRWGKVLGHEPQTLVAPLGVEVPTPDPGAIPAGTDTETPYFVTLGTVEPRKNHALLLDVWEDLAKGAAPPRLYIIGRRGWENAETFARLDRKPAFVTELGGLEDSAAFALIAGARAVLFPSLAEGYGLPPAEAIALGVPVICAPLPVYREILGNIPVYAESGDVYQWKQSIIRLAEGKQAAKRLEPQTAAGLPTWSDHFNLVLKVT